MKKIFIEIGHPAHVHLFKNIYWELEKRGWQGLFITKDKDCAINLLKSYKLPFKILGKTQDKIVNKILTLPNFALKMYKLARIYKPDLFVSRVSPVSGWSSFLFRKPHITLTDTENVKLSDSISEPFADVILTSSSYRRNHGGKQIRYPGYHELAYLHPKYFTPNPSVLEEEGIDMNEKYAIVRFVSWTAHHDIGHRGFSKETKIKLVTELSKYIKVFISSEGDLPEELKGFQIKIKPENMHNALYYAQLLVGESATMASECAMVGTPAIYINNSHFGSLDSQAEYGLVHLFSEDELAQEHAIQKAIEIVSKPDIKNEYRERAQKMLENKIDVTSFMIWFVENYPESVKEVKSPGFSFDRFK
ncbi:MAG: DUF354 domain-containing protein [Candidatus Cloacimonadaceae bacterium]